MASILRNRKPASRLTREVGSVEKKQETSMKVAVAGLGRWGKQILSCLSRSPRFEVICGIDPKPPADVTEFRKSHQFMLESTLDKALADPDVEGVILATPHALHEEQALAVIAAGKNLFCEKPLTMTGEGARRVVEACRRAGKVLGVGHERRWEPAFEELQRLIDAGTLGKLLLFGQLGQAVVQ
jgi:predicted dehydrogenase